MVNQFWFNSRVATSVVFIYVCFQIVGLHNLDSTRYTLLKRKVLIYESLLFCNHDTDLYRGYQGKEKRLYLDSRSCIPNALPV